MLASLAAFWAGLPQWMRDAIKVAGVVLAIVFLGRQYIKGKENEAVRRNNEKRDKDAAEVESKIINTITENSNEMVRKSDAVRSAPAADRLPDGTASLPPHHYRD